MNNLKDNCRIAVVQAEPVLFDAAASAEKAVKLIGEASKQNAEMIVFPELFIPGYPFGLTFEYRVGCRGESGRTDWKRYCDNSIVIPGLESDMLCKAAKEADAYVSIGISERDAVTGTLYNSNLMIAPDGCIENVHRKLKPTGAERMVWGDADRGYFPVAETPWGPVGCMICWESYMPLARTALYKKGISIYISCNTNDYDEWLNTCSHIAMEGRCYFINADLYFRKASYPNDLTEFSLKQAADLPEIVCRGGSCIYGPDGKKVTDPVWDCEEIIYADLDMQRIPASRMEFDPVGHYARNDVLDLRITDL